MTRGKYSARAANRLAALDNELLAQKIAEAAQLQEQNSELQDELERERASRHNEIVRRADILAASEIALMRVQMQEQTDAHQQRCDAIALWLCNFMRRLDENHPNVGCVPADIDEVLRDITGSNLVGEYLAALFVDVEEPTRSRRRRRASSIRHAQDVYRIDEMERKALVLAKIADHAQKD